MADVCEICLKPLGKIIRITVPVFPIRVTPEGRLIQMVPADTREYGPRLEEIPSTRHMGCAPAPWYGYE